MIGRFEPDCECGCSPMPQVNHLQVEEIPYDIEFILVCGKCKKHWKEIYPTFEEEKK